MCCQYFSHWWQSPYYNTFSLLQIFKWKSFFSFSIFFQSIYPFWVFMMKSFAIRFLFPIFIKMMTKKEKYWQAMFAVSEYTFRVSTKCFYFPSLMISVNKGGKASLIKSKNVKFCSNLFWYLLSILFLTSVFIRDIFCDYCYLLSSMKYIASTFWIQDSNTWLLSCKSSP